MINYGTDFDEALDIVVAKLLPSANILADATSRAPLACLMTILRPHVALRVDPSKHKVDIDLRRRRWAIKITVFDLDGEEDDCAFDEETVQGLDEVGVAIRECIELAHEDADFNILCVPELTDTNLKKRMAGLHPAISRGGGKATTRINYALANGKEFDCITHISRA